MWRFVLVKSDEAGESNVSNYLKEGSLACSLPVACPTSKHEAALGESLMYVFSTSERRGEWFLHVLQRGRSRLGT